MKAQLKPPTKWLIATAIVILTVAIVFIFFDVPIVNFFARPFARKTGVLGKVGTTLPLSIEIAAVVIFSGLRWFRGDGGVSKLSRVLTLACIMSVCSFALNDVVLKPFFGVPGPRDFLTLGVGHGFRFFAGSGSSSFPSGHMMLTGSFAGVLMAQYRRLTVWLCLSLFLFLAALFFVVLDFHFASDVIAGTALGVSLGFWASGLWLDRKKQA